ncbi:Carbohydrate sulfotransferase 12, partial [Armadillidium vulgare]
SFYHPIQKLFYLFSKREIPFVTDPKSHIHNIFKESLSRKPVTYKVFKRLKSSLLSFLIVRHPFERLVSAFESKLIRIANNHDREFFYKYVIDIITHYRKNDTNAITNNRYQNVSTLPVTNNTTFDEPTFEEFVDYLLNRSVDKYDEHWRPISNLCHICSYDFDFVIKYENFQREFESLIQFFKEFGRLPEEFKIGWINKAKNSFKYKVQYKDKIKKYYSTLPKDKIQSLYNIYKSDFLYFDYDKEQYM